MRKMFGLGLILKSLFLSGCHDSSDSSFREDPSSSNQPLTLDTYTAGEDGIFAVASTLIAGEKDAILVDAQFQKKYAQQVVEKIKKSGKNLKYIYISHSDPDYYFGTAEILKAFPHTKVVSTAQTAYLIGASKDDKLAVWREQLGTDAPEHIIIPQALNAGYLELDGKRIDIKLDPEDSAHSFLWIPSLKTVLGGISVTYNSHLWMADTQGGQGIDRWIKQIATIKALNPEKVIPSHYIKSDFSPEALDWIKDYLLNFKTAINQAESSAEIIQWMDVRYPKLDDAANLKMSAQVFAQEIDWKVASPYPVIGQKILADFGSLKFNLEFIDNTTLSFSGVAGSTAKETVQYTPVEIAKNIFMVYWHEDQSVDNVVHIQDYNRNSLDTHIAAPDGSFTHLQGSISGVKGVIQDPALQGPLNVRFPYIGKMLHANFADRQFDLQFTDQQNLTVTTTVAPIQTINVKYSVRPVAENLFMLSWTDPKIKRNVVQILDDAKKIMYQHVAEANGKFTHLTGTFSSN